MSLVARHLENSGIPTIVIGSALDIVTEVGVPRFLFVDLPLGNPCGPPDEAAEQLAIIDLALHVSAAAIAARTTVHAPVNWPTETWRNAYMRVDNAE